jgi:putative spermidine/putrescine transport system substrate-binding protein
MLNRRNTVKLLGLAAGSSLLPSLAWAQDKSIAFASWGGTTQDGQKAAWADPFTAETGVQVLQDGPTDYGKFVTMVESGNVEWDVVDVENDFAVMAGKKGLLEPLDFSVIKRDDLDPRFVNDYSVGSFFYAYTLGYNKDVYKDAQPKTWNDLFDLEKFPGKRTYYKWSGPGVYEIALLADGVKPEELYPLDIDRALKKLDTIKKEIVWWASGAQSQQLLASAETPMGMFWSGRVHLLMKDGANVDMSWEQNVTAADVLVVPKGTKNKEQAMKFLARATSAEGQAEMAKLLGYSPTNLKSIDLLDEETRESLPSKYAAQNVPINIEYWADNRDMLGKRWYDWQAA